MFRRSDEKQFLSAIGSYTDIYKLFREIEDLMIYPRSLNKWFKGTSVIYPRCLFASASNGDFAYVAGGIAVVTK